MCVSPVYRFSKFEEILTNNLALTHMEFISLEATNLQKTFYNDFNRIRKLKNDEMLNVDELLSYESRIHQYIDEKGFLFSITSLDADQG